MEAFVDMLVGRNERRFMFTLTTDVIDKAEVAAFLNSLSTLPILLIWRFSAFLNFKLLIVISTTNFFRWLAWASSSLLCQGN